MDCVFKPRRFVVKETSTKRRKNETLTQRRFNSMSTTTRWTGGATRWTGGATRWAGDSCGGETRDGCGNRNKKVEGLRLEMDEASERVRAAVRVGEFHLGLCFHSSELNLVLLPGSPHEPEVTREL